MSHPATTPWAAGPLEAESDPGRPARKGAVYHWLGDRMNALLVKETRQALKSRQFLWTFLLLLVCAWGWSLLGVAWQGPSAVYGARGAELLRVYFSLLAFPLLVIVPYGAYRSLAAEREDRTFELLTITTLRPRQIIGGKLASAALQMVVFLSAVSPCLAFTYLLRGVGVMTILMLLVGLCLLSLGLSTLSLFLATLAYERNRQVVISVAVVVGLFLTYVWVASIAVSGALENDYPVDDPTFWIVLGILLAVFLSYLVLFFLGAAAQISFTSDNRSTAVRWVLIAQQALFIGCFAWCWIRLDPGEEAMPMLLLTALLLHWGVVGSLLIGESPWLSPRVRRELPQSFLGRLLLSWLQPGPAAAYWLVLSQYLAALAVVGGALAVSPVVAPDFSKNWSGQDAERIVRFGVLAFSYLAIYLGLGLLLGALARRLGFAWTLLPGVIGWLLVMIGALVPLTLQLTLPDLRSSGYTLLQISNPIWTLYEASSRTFSPELQVVQFLLPVFGVLVAAGTLPLVLGEVSAVRAPLPARVVLEDAQVAAAQRPALAVPQSPWD